MPKNYVGTYCFFVKYFVYLYEDYESKIYY
jgi:hypothetical protein